MGTSLVRREPRAIGAELEVGPLGFGCWRLVAMSRRDARERVEAALDAGLDLVDTADVYGLDWGGDGFGAAERLLGEALAPGLRPRMVLATKGGISGYPHLDECDLFARYVLPALDHAPLDTRTATSASGAQRPDEKRR